MLKICSRCNEEKPQDRFVPCKDNKSGWRAYCKDCNNAYYAKRRKEKYELVRSYEKKFHYQRRLKYQYNTTEEHIESLKAIQKGKCAICEQEKRLVIDHCHSNQNVRGLLCNNCNTGLGQFMDNVEFLESAIEYLKVNKIESQ